jgi:DNA-binding NarL/FixJ family response regulator
MQLLDVVLLQSDPSTMQSLVALLRNHFRSVRHAESLDDLRTSAAKRRAEVAILDMEAISLLDLKALSDEFPAVSIICNHRLADDAMWAVALSAGAADCCPSYDTGGILRSAVRHAPRARSMAA